MRIRIPELLAVAAIAGAGCTTTAEVDDKPKLVVAVPITGTFATKGLLHQNAVIMALQHLSAAGFTEKTGLDFSLRVVNSGAAGSSAENITAVHDDVQQIIDDHTRADGGVDVLGIITSTGDAQQGAAGLAATYGIPYFEASSGSGEDEFLDHTAEGHGDGYTDEQFSYLFGTRPLCDYEAALTIPLMIDRWNGKKLAIVRGDEVHDILHSDTLRAGLAANPLWTGSIIDSGDAAENGDFVLDYADPTFQDDLEAMVAGFQPDIVFFHLRGDSHNLRFLQDANRAGYEGAIPTCGMARSKALIDNASNGNISDYLTDRLFFVMRGPKPGPVLDAFKADFAEMWVGDGLEADTFTPAMYDAAMLLALSAAKTGAVSDHVGVRDNLYSVSEGGTSLGYSQTGDAIDLIGNGGDLDWQGVSGSLDIREDNSVPGSFYVEEVISNGDGSYSYRELTTPARVDL